MPNNDQHSFLSTHLAFGRLFFLVHLVRWQMWFGVATRLWGSLRRASRTWTVPHGQNWAPKVASKCNRLKPIDSTLLTPTCFTSPSGPGTVGHRPWTIHRQWTNIASSKWDRNISFFFLWAKLISKGGCDTMWLHFNWSSIALLAVEATWNYDSVVLEYSNPGPCVEHGGAIRDLGFFTRQLLRPSRLLRTSTFTIQICSAPWPPSPTYLFCCALLPTSQPVVHLSFCESS